MGIENTEDGTPHQASDRTAQIPSAGKAGAEVVAPQVGNGHEPVLRTELVAKSVAVEFSGPIPPAHMLEDYERVCPGAADRILGMAEREQIHAHAMDRRAARYPAIIEVIGLIGGLTVALLAIAASVYCILSGYAWAGVGLFGTTTVAVVGKIIHGRHQNQPPPAPSGPQRQRKRRR